MVANMRVALDMYCFNANMDGAKLYINLLENQTKPPAN